MTSCIDSPRSALARVSPSTQRTASMMFDLPQPFGPTTPTRWPGVRTVVGSTNVLKPASLSLERRTSVLLGRGCELRGMIPSDADGPTSPQSFVMRIRSSVNPDLDRLQSYPFEKLRTLFQGLIAPPDYPLVRLSIGEPQHPTPAFIEQALTDNVDGLSIYPTTQGTDALRAAIAAWLERRPGWSGGTASPVSTRTRKCCR